jgi:group II intron reverse transcriptase/maturase
MSLAKIDAIIAALRAERYRWTPARRVYIEKPNSTKKRPLGLPTWTDKLVQEVLRLILEAYYEPQFSGRSHGFRPDRGCHTALREMHRTWNGTVWFIEGDISACFDSLDHGVMLGILAESIADGRFLRLIDGLLRAGYLEDWRYHATLSGAPQGGVVSPILANIYLDRLDKWVESTLLPMYNRGDKRKSNVAYTRRNAKVQYLKRKGRHAEAASLRKQNKALPTGDPTDPGYRRLRFLRYADDFILGFAGPLVEAEAIKRQIGDFLSDTLKLRLSEEKTLITHARTHAARFLGYEVHVIHDNTARRNGRRDINGVIGLRVPADVVKSKCRPYMQGNAIRLRPERVHDSVYSIVSQYQMEYRGVVQYYQLAYNLRVFSRLKYVMGGSLLKTLARKLRLSVRQAHDRYSAILQTPHGPYTGLRVVVERDGKRPLVAAWGGIPLRRNLTATISDQPEQFWYARTDLEQRLLADACELCGSQDNVQVHHIRALKDLRQPGRADKPEWVKTMIARQRKTLVVCHACHAAIHNGAPPKRRATTR